MGSRDYSAFTAPISAEEVKAFRREMPGHHTLAEWGLFALVMVIFLGIGLSIFSSFLTVSHTIGGTSLAPWIVGAVLIVVVGLAVTARAFMLRANWSKTLRFTRFAQANSLQYSTNDSAPMYPGMIFGLGSSRRVPVRFSGSANSFFDVGNYQYTTGSGKNRTTHVWGFIAIKLDRMVPQIVLDAKSNNFLGSNLPSSFSRGQVLSLEGDFDRHFKLYCPKEYERDALYIFTPDLMALLIDHATPFDVELVDDWMFLYSGARLRLDNVAALEQIFNVIDTVGAKTFARTDRYADSNAAGARDSTAPGAPLASRMATNTVAPQGRRLRKNVPTTLIVVAVAMVAWWWFNVGTRIFLG